MLTQAEARALRSILERAAPPALPFPDLDTIQPGDVVQLHPRSVRTFGGLLMLVTRAETYELRGPLLRPHRGGDMLAWHRAHPTDVLRIGRAPWPQPPFAWR